MTDACAATPSCICQTWWMNGRLYQADFTKPTLLIQHDSADITQVILPCRWWLGNFAPIVPHPRAAHMVASSLSSSLCLPLSSSVCLLAFLFFLPPLSATWIVETDMLLCQRQTCCYHCLLSVDILLSLSSLTLEHLAITLVLFVLFVLLQTLCLSSSSVF